jgi:hypothetical protein
MRKKILYLTILLFVTLYAGFLIRNYIIGNGTDAVMCAMDAMQCPDGSFVGRVGPKCEFATCPEGVNLEKKVEAYLRENIVALSPVSAVLGGTWYVVSVTVDPDTNSGTVIYEDGHIQEERGFSYTLDGVGNISQLTIK